MTDRKTWPLALSIHPEGTAPEKLSEMAEAGICQAELSMPHLTSVYGDFDYPHRFSSLRREARNLGVDITSVHLPYCGVAPEDPLQDVRDETVRIQKELISVAAEAGVGKCIMHPSRDGTPDAERDERLKYAADSISRINEFASKCGVTLCIENLPRKCLGRTPAEMRMFLENIPGLRMVMDLNHSLLQDNVTFIHSIGKWIVSLHVSDYDLIDERHMLPGLGKNDWNGILKALEDENYRGRFLYELRWDYGYSFSEIAENYNRLVLCTSTGKLSEQSD